MRTEEMTSAEINSTGTTEILAEAVEAWFAGVAYEEKAQAFKALCEACGFEQVMNYLTEKHWEQKLQLGKALVGCSYFDYLPRPVGKKKTIAAYYRSIANGGAQRVVALLCNRWAEMRDEQGEYLYNVVLLTDDGPQEGEYYLSPLVKRAYLPTVRNGEAYPQRFAAWQQIISTYAIDVVVSSMWVDPCTFWDLLSVKGHASHPAFVIHSHNFCAVPFSFNFPGALELTYKYQLCDGVVALSNCDQLYIKCFNNNVKYIVNPLSFEPDKIPNSSYEPNTLIWCSRIAVEKRPVEVIRAMAYIVKEIPEAKLLIVGSGVPDLIEAMKREVLELGLVNNVEFVGFTLEVAKYYSRASIMLLTSKYEGFPMTIGEAFSYGVPVVGYDLPNLTFMQDGRGIFSVPQGHYKELAQQAIELLKKPIVLKEAGAQGKQQVIELAQADIEGEWRQLFLALDQPREKEIPSDLHTILSGITEFQHIGRERVIKNWEQKYAKLDDLRNTLMTEKYKYKYLAEKRQEGIEFWKKRGPELLGELKLAREEKQQLEALIEQLKNEKAELEKKLKAVKNSGWGRRVTRS